MCIEECAVTLLISKLMAYEFEGGDWFIRQMAISQRLMHIDIGKGSVNDWLRALFVCCIYSCVCLSREVVFIGLSLCSAPSFTDMLGLIAIHFVVKLHFYDDSTSFYMYEMLNFNF